MKETKKRLYVEKDGFWTEASMLLMTLAMVFLLIGSIGRWDDRHYLITMVALPICSGLLFVLCLLLFGKRAFWTTVIPVVAGVVFFVFRIMGEENEWIKVGLIAFYMVITVVYAMTFSIPKLKWLLALILLGVFAWHLGLKDLPVLMDLKNPVSFVDGMQEMSVLTIVLSLLCVSLAMKYPKSQPAGAEQPLPPEEISAPEPEEVPAPVPRETTVPEPEKKLSRRERRRLERERKAAEKAGTPAAVVPVPGATPAPVPIPESEPAETPAQPVIPPAEIPAEEPAEEPTEEPAEEPTGEPAEEIPVEAEEPAEEPMPQTFWEEAERPAPEPTPIQEVEIPAEPAAAYPLAEPFDPAEEAAPAPEDGPETP